MTQYLASRSTDTFLDPRGPFGLTTPQNPLASQSQAQFPSQSQAQFPSQSQSPFASQSQAQFSSQSQVPLGSSQNSRRFPTASRSTDHLIDVRKISLKAPYQRKQKVVEVLRVGAKTLHDRRGISRDTLVSHPSPDKQSGLPGGFPSYEAPISVGQQYGGPSNCTSDTESDTGQSWTTTSNGWTTGNTTERDSIITLEDEFDRKASSKVQGLFNDIDSMLFEDSSRGPENLRGECKEWVHMFKHLRLHGHQIVQPQDDGYQIITQDTSPRPPSGLLTDITEVDLSASHTANELQVKGRHVHASNYHDPLVKLKGSSSHSHDSPHTHLEEEIIAKDGVVEDIIAIDNKSMDDDLRSSSIRRRKRGLPPVTPQACIKDNISGAIFDYMWTESVSWLRGLLRMYAESLELSEDDDPHHSSTNLPPFPSSGSLGYYLDEFLAPSREASNLSNSRPLEKVSRYNTNFPYHIQEEPSRLDGVLTISSKHLQMREHSSLNREPTETMMASGFGFAPRPFSSNKQGRPGSVQKNPSQEGRLTSASRRPVHPRTRLLAPLDRPKTPSVDEESPKFQQEVIRGHRLDSMMNKDPKLLLRNGALPPIPLSSENSDLNLHSQGISPTNTSRINPLKKSGTRASSAVHAEKEQRIPFKDREKTVVPIETNRPNTTLSIYRSETPFGGNRRSSTPQGFNNILRPGNLPGGSSSQMQMSITGSGINPHVDGAHGHGPDIEHIDADIHASSQWDSPYRRLMHNSVLRNLEGSSSLNNPQVRRARQQSYNMPVR